jgi:hypothetical protein
MDSREADRSGHPPACTCVICNKKRLAGVSQNSRVKGCPICDGSPKFRFQHGQYWDIYVDYDGKIRGSISRVVLAKYGRFRCVGCHGIVRKDEIDDPILESVKDQVYQYWENRRAIEKMLSQDPACNNREQQEEVDSTEDIKVKNDASEADSTIKGKLPIDIGYKRNFLDSLFDKIQKLLFGADR